MKKSFSKVLYLSIVAFAFSITTACNPLEQLKDVDDPGIIRESGKITQILMNESFERPTLLSSNPETDPFGWRAFIWDHGTPVLGANSSNVSAVIMNNSKMGEASDGENALYFYGREGHSIHALYLFTHSYDLSQFDEVLIAFDYLIFGLNDPDDVVEEYLKLEVCADSAANCGVGNTVNGNKLKSSAWKTLYKDTGENETRNLDGKNHRHSDWHHAGVKLDISNFPQKTTFTLRLSALMTDGFVGNNSQNRLEDGAAVDNIRVVATVSRNPNDTGPSDPDCQPGVSISEKASCYDLPFKDLDNPLGL